MLPYRFFLRSLPRPKCHWNPIQSCLSPNQVSLFLFCSFFVSILARYKQLIYTTDYYQFKLSLYLIIINNHRRPCGRCHTDDYYIDPSLLVLLLLLLSVLNWLNLSKLNYLEDNSPRKVADTSHRGCESTQHLTEKI